MKDRAGEHRFVFISLSLIFWLSGLPGAAQSAPTAGTQSPNTGSATSEPLSPYEGQNVAAVEVAGRPDSASSNLTALYVQQANQPFSKDKVGKTADALKAATHCDSVRIQVEAEANGVRVLFILEPAVYFGIFQFPGADRFPYSRLVQVANYPTQAPFSANDVEQDRQSLISFFQQQGYFQCQVNAEVKVDSAHGLANIVFHVTLAHKAKFGVIDITDAEPEQAAKLKHSLQTIVAGAIGAAIRPGHTYHYSNVLKATQYLQTQLERQGRLGAQVKLNGAQYHSETNRADIQFSVAPGPSSTVAIQGAHVWSWTRKSLLPVYQGVGVDEESLEEGRQALVSYFQAEGFFDAKVDAHLKNDKGNNVIVYNVAKEKKHKVSEVTISGDKALKESDLAPLINVKKSHLFSPGNFSDRLMRSSVNSLTALYRSEGFSSATVTSKAVNNGGDVQAHFLVTEGPRDVVNSIQIEGADTFPEAKFAPDGLKVAKGQPYSQSRIEKDRANIISRYLQAGYLSSSFRETAAEVSKADPHHIDVVYHIYEGPRVDAGNVITLGQAHTKQRLIDEDVAQIKPGQPLTESELLISGSKLYDHSGVFDWAEVDPRREITTQTKEDVLVKVHEASRNDLTYGFGFEVINRGGSIPSGTVALPNLPPVGLPTNFTTSQTTFYGPRGTIQYTRNNVGGKGDSLSFTGFAGRLDQRGAAYYIVPNFRWSQWKATTSASAERNGENPIFSAQQELISSQLQRSLNSFKQSTLFLRYSFSQTDLTRIEIPALVPTQDQHVRLSTLAANVTRDTRDNAMDEHKGVLQTIELDFNSTKLGSSVDFAKLTGQAAYYKQGFHNIIWANSLRISLAQTFANSYVPLSEEFFTGGGNSLRGFPLDGAGPQRQIQVCSSGSSTDCGTIQVPSGGKELLLLNSEARIPLPFKKGLGIVLFYDGGNVFPSVGFHDFASLYSNSVGIGLRYATPVGPIRIDLGHTFNPAPGISSVQPFVSIGQAF